MSGRIRLAILVIGCFALTNARAEGVADMATADAFDGLPNVKIEYYDVGGIDEESINASLEATAPRRPNGGTAMGLTTYNFKYATMQAKRGSVCTIVRANVEFTSTVHLPRLVNEPSVPDRIMVRWRPFIAGLRLHEAGHVRIENDHLNDIKAALAGVRCDQVQSAFDAAANRVGALQKAYDLQTNDGATQGAVLR
jgi:predicted secreted Zn-dependent protease